MKIRFFNKEYSDESLGDLPGNIIDAIQEDNELLGSIPKDENGFMKGTFTATIDWDEE